MKKLENLRWVPRWVSHLGCIKGCLDYLGLDVSDAWLFGATGHAFVLNVHEVVCPSGPTAWNTEMLPKLGQNVGYEIGGVFATKSAADFAEKQKLAWERVRSAIDQGLPCCGWELDIPEYYVVYGYDDSGYYFSGPGCDGGKGPKPWQELGNSGIGVIEMYSVKPGEMADDAQTVKEALAFALEHATSPAKWIFPEYKAGLAGYDNWIRALEGGTADGFGMAYNAAVWCECRSYAVSFLQEAKERLGGQVAALFDEALERYQVVHENLQTVAEAFPFHGMEPGHIKDRARIRTALDALRTARHAEAGGLEALQRIVNER
ncbi:MAG: hypothetical protein SVX38_10590 [Chloroflexota bacterium]|nr:hypothetical protein [Chloroflexota bacterium]